ncbi:hypothetical protein [Streptomyces swartbergensis]|uniref:hypothetical protein n=1 Tax=Streptomyces swartbergensis TaxID=487165 RepID=UPI003815FA8B
MDEVRRAAAGACGEPPSRLLPGKAAYDIATARLEMLRAGLDTWRDVTVSADSPAA